jgi:hypothetical protein
VAGHALDAAARFAMLERIARETATKFPRQTVILWFGIQRSRVKGISLDAALAQFVRGEDDPRLLDAGDRLLSLLRQIDETFPELTAEAEARVDAILDPSV